MTAEVTIKNILVEFLVDSTEVFMTIQSTEPQHPIWGTGCKHKSFPATQSLEEILPGFKDYLTWEFVCNTCHKPKGVDSSFCSNSFHLEHGVDVLRMFDDLEEIGNP